MELTTSSNLPTVLQVANMGKIQGANFKLRGNRRAFIIKNLASSAVTLKVRLAGGDTIETTFEPGWNKELIYEVVTDATSMNLQYGF